MIQFPDELIGCSSVINIIVSHIDPHQVSIMFADTQIIPFIM